MHNTTKNKKKIDITKKGLLDEIKETVLQIKQEYHWKIQNSRIKEEGYSINVLSLFRDWFYKNEQHLFQLLEKGKIVSKQGVMLIQYRYEYLLEELDYHYPSDLLFQLDSLKIVLDEQVIISKQGDED